jgi:hypothetical protein
MTRRQFKGSKSTGKEVSEVMAPIEEEFRNVLQHDSADRLAQAGEGWKEPPLSFYYPGNEISIDQAVIAVTRTQLTVGSNLPEHVWNNLRIMINGTTRVKEAFPLIGSALGSAIEDA